MIMLIRLFQEEIPFKHHQKQDGRTDGPLSSNNRPAPRDALKWLN